MEGNATSDQTGRAKKKATTNSRRVWTYMEEKELVCALRDLVVKGQKCDNGFRSGYLLILENVLVNKFPGTNLKGDPHINSKIHVWKKQYSCLKTMLGNSGIGLNTTTFRIEALPEVWDAHMKVDPTARTLKNKSFPFYSDWVEIFGNDRATGIDSQGPCDAEQDVINQTARRPNSSTGLDQGFDTTAQNENNLPDFNSFNVGESSSATKDKGKGVKRKQVDPMELQFIDTVGHFADKADSRFGQIADTMGNIAQRVGFQFDACKKRGEVYDHLGLMDFLTVGWRVKVAQYLCNNSKDMDLFFSLPDDVKKVLVMEIMKKLENAD
ncbi:hypothetical protein ACS0TY_033340 [Phlomoides rotata]